MSLAKHMSLGLLLALCIPTAIACIDVMALSVALDKIRFSFVTTLDKTQWLLSAYTIGNAAFLIVTGRLADKYGCRLILFLGLILFALSSLGAAFSFSINILIMSRALQGVASSMMMTAVISLIMYLFSAEQRKKVIAVWAFANGLGLVLGPVVGALLVHFLDWRAIFLVNIPVCVFSCYLVKFYITESKSSHILIKIDWFEALLITTLMIVFVAFLSQGAVLGWFSKLTMAIVGIFIVLGGVFFWVEKHKKNPLIDLSLFKLPQFAIGVACGFIGYFCLYGFLFLFGVYLEKECGLSVLETGFAFMPVSGAMMLGAHFVAKKICEWGVKKLMRFGFILGVIASCAMLLIRSNTPIELLMIIFFIFGFSIAVINVPSMAIATEYISKEKSGTASGIIFTIRWLGGSVGVIIIEAVFQFYGLFASNLIFLGIFSIGWMSTMQSILGGYYDPRK